MATPPGAGTCASTSVDATDMYPIEEIVGADPVLLLVIAMSLAGYAVREMVLDPPDDTDTVEVEDMAYPTPASCAPYVPAGTTILADPAESVVPLKTSPVSTL